MQFILTQDLFPYQFNGSRGLGLQSLNIHLRFSHNSLNEKEKKVI
jgi:hypothetical protein